MQDPTQNCCALNVTTYTFLLLLECLPGSTQFSCVLKENSIPVICSLCAGPPNGRGRRAEAQPRGFDPGRLQREALQDGGGRDFRCSTLPHRAALRLRQGLPLMILVFIWSSFFLFVVSLFVLSFLLFSFLCFLFFFRFLFVCRCC